MFKKLLFSAVCAAILSLAPAAHATDIVNAGGGVLAHIAFGGDWNTTITLVNLSAASGTYELHFIGSDGQPLTVPTTAGTNSVISGTLNSAGSVIIQTTDNTADAKTGWAYVITGSFTPLAGSAIFRLTRGTAPPFEASLPLDTDAHYTYGLPVDELNAQTGFAVANSYQNSTTNFTLTFYDMSGTQGFTTTFQLGGLAHDAFMLQDRYPQLKGLQGMLLIQADYYVNILGLRSNGQSFSSITPLVLQGW
jgi:hypothetical protein